MVNETAVCLVMVSWIAWLTVSWDKKLYIKAFLLQKEAGQPYDFFGAANWLNLHNLCYYFALNHILDNYNLYMNMIVCLVDLVHLSYDFIIID